MPADKQVAGSAVTIVDLTQANSRFARVYFGRRRGVPPQSSRVV